MLNKNLSWTKVYRIKRISDGLFKNKGFLSGFSKEGYTWQSYKSVIGHISNNKSELKGCMLITYILDQVAQETIIYE